MKPERWQQIERLYYAALEQEPEVRTAFLNNVCAGDGPLRREIETLLGCEQKAEQFFEVSALEAAAKKMVEDRVKSMVGRQFGSYKILSQLGAGGMGEVYLAEDSSLDRKVAIKFVQARLTADEQAKRRLLREAQAAARLEHPNICAIYEVGQLDNVSFIVMQYVGGETLGDALQGKSLGLGDSLDLAIQIADALSAAHSRGIIHCDIKPQNIIINSHGQLKVLDFGLARVIRQGELLEGKGATESLLSAPGMIVGTPAYMSPEQVRGETLDALTDIFSFGAVLYEMVAGCHPFADASPAATLSAVLTREPAPLARYVSDLPHELQRIVRKALSKGKEARYQGIKDLLIDLRELKQDLEFKAKLERSGEQGVRVGAPATERTGIGAPAETMEPLEHQAGSEIHADLERARINQLESTRESAPTQTAVKHRGESVRRHRLLLAACALVLTFGGSAWLYWHGAKLNRARASLPRIEELAAAERYFEAYDLAVDAQRYLPHEPALTRQMRTIADDLSVVTDPPGAQVYLKRFARESGEFPARQLIGITPINHRQIARGAYVLYVEKDGYAGLERSLSGVIMRLGGMLVPSPPIRFEAKMLESAEVPARMAFVPGGDYRLVSWARPTEARVRLDPYFIDRYEVTNREYKEFISAGGYLKREYWRHPFARDGRKISWEEALREFKDKTSLPGPRSWKNQEFPEGKVDHPVSDISWYEAAAYAAFRGKELPTVFQWEKAARNGLTMSAGVVMPWGLLTGTPEGRANFGGRGTLPVESLEFGLSPYGCYHMAGNVAEWCRNESSAGFTTTGGSWDDEPYLFGRYGDYPAFYSSDRLGFRCALTAPGAAGDQGVMHLSAEGEVPTYTPARAASFRAWQDIYRYAQPPLAPQIVEVKETDTWRREKVTYVGAEDERAIAYLYLPKHHQPPWQVIQFVPPDDVFFGFTALSDRVEVQLAPFIKSGRAVLAVVLKGFREREWPTTRTPPSRETVEYRDQILNWMVDERRGLDYVATRSDLDSSRVVYIAASVDGVKLGLPAVETRYRSVVLVGAALYQTDTRLRPEINPINLASHIRAPKLLLQGRYDEDSRLKTQAEPLHKLLIEPKRIVLYDGGHVPPSELYVPVINRWLDETLGAVRHR
jgi:serine/threonine protein kinase/formylglycine-generating enzyme required for sulfatase activity